VVQPTGEPRRQGIPWALRSCAASRRFRNRGNDCLGTNNDRSTITFHCRHGNRLHIALSATARTMALCTSRVTPCICWQERTTTSSTKDRISEEMHGEKRMLAPPAGSQLLPRWARGPLSVPCRMGTPAYKLQVKTRDSACIYALPCVLKHRTKPPRLGGLWRCHVSRDSEPHPSAWEGSDATTCPMTPNLAPPRRWAPVNQCVLWLQTPLFYV
jgi:hypothetical protein